MENKQKASLCKSPRLCCATYVCESVSVISYIGKTNIICLPPSLQKVANLAPVARCMVRANHRLKGIVGNPYVSMVVNIG